MTKFELTSPAKEHLPLFVNDTERVEALTTAWASQGTWGVPHEDPLVPGGSGRRQDTRRRHSPNLATGRAVARAGKSCFS